MNTGSATSQGDVAHAAASARTTYGIDGTGVKVGVLSDGVDSLAARQATGDLPPTCPQAGACVTVVPGQAGSGDEGTAMLEIVHDLAPGAKLYFATAFNGSASFATNILALKNTYGCDIIVDDVTYFDEGAFQDGVIAQAVNTVKAAGALFFSSAGNSGRLNAGTSGTWEGDFVDSGTTIAEITGSYGAALPIHSFNGLTGGSAANSDPLTANAPSAISLKWSDPLGGATTDYDLFLMDSDLTTIFDGSVDDQTIPGQDPFEIMGNGFTGERIVVVRWSGPDQGPPTGHQPGPADPRHRGSGRRPQRRRRHHLRGRGQREHRGRRRLHRRGDEPDRDLQLGRSPEDLLQPGRERDHARQRPLRHERGAGSLQKPDITAADCVTTTTPGFISVLRHLRRRSPRRRHRGPPEVRAQPPVDGAGAGRHVRDRPRRQPRRGRDRDAGVGIVMANLAAGVLTSVPAVDFFTVSPCRVFDTREVGGPTAGAPLTCGSDRDFTIVGGTCGVPVGREGGVAQRDGDGAVGRRATCASSPPALRRPSSRA